jgi:hypothetical protein
VDKTQNPSRDSGDQPGHADIVVFCDESGAKGYADQLEKEPGEIGIFAGFPVQRENLGLLAAEFKNERANSVKAPERSISLRCRQRGKNACARRSTRFS